MAHARPERGRRQGPSRRHAPTLAPVTDAGKVRLGAYAPRSPRSRTPARCVSAPWPTLAPVADAGKVRLGAYAPTLAPVADAGKVRLGAYAPTLRPARQAAA